MLSNIMNHIRCPKHTEMNMSFNTLAIFPTALRNSHQSTTLPSTSAEKNPWWLALNSNHPSCSSASFSLYCQRQRLGKRMRNCHNG
ncbi:hypothetical protein CEXT_320251 [Caerostris extrusa]|uniref:Uncharacterized protein n=1 Tax=Caerostris extrusa TaxID=172846 RepID=A0AAV4WXL6_CAEEX|nr:hypothetical protein CEXT_320251 [Caerostris extrusa]